MKLREKIKRIMMGRWVIPEELGGMDVDRAVHRGLNVPFGFRWDDKRQTIEPDGEMDIYEEWAEKSEELWFERAKQLPQVEALLRVARAANTMLRHGNSPAWKQGLIPWREIAEGINVDDLGALAEALEEVKDIL